MSQAVPDTSPYMASGSDEVAPSPTAGKASSASRRQDLHGDFDPGIVAVNDFLTEEEEAAILEEVGEELLVQGEDQSILPPADVDFMTEEQESEIIFQIAAWVDTFMFGGFQQSATPLGDPEERGNGRTGLTVLQNEDRRMDTLQNIHFRGHSA